MGNLKLRETAVSFQRQNWSIPGFCPIVFGSSLALKPDLWLALLTLCYLQPAAWAQSVFGASVLTTEFFHYQQIIYLGIFKALCYLIHSYHILTILSFCSAQHSHIKNQTGKYKSVIYILTLENILYRHYSQGAVELRVLTLL